MTLIECFTEAHIDNIAACLRLRPEEMVIIGNASEMADPVKRYKKLLKKRGIATKVNICDVQRMDLDDIFAVLKKEVYAAKECVIDLTGGDECVIMAAGAVLAGLSVEARQSVRVVKFDHKAQVVQDCIHDNRKIQTKPVNLTVEEFIELHGGMIHPNTCQPSEDTSRQDMAVFWDVVSEAPKDWNKAIAYLGEFESKSDSKMHVSVPLSPIRKSIADFEKKEKAVRELLGKLDEKGVIDNQSSPNVLKYTYKSPRFRYYTQKAGNVLEVKTLLESRSVLEQGAPYFCDCQMSVSIDWDGEVHDPAERVSETRNEIDVVLMCGTTPLFVSCKNGNIEEAEMYKLHTVAERFGGPYAKKMLIATELDLENSATNRAIDQRARDMHISLVAGAAKLSREEWRNIFKEAMR